MSMDSIVKKVGGSIDKQIRVATIGVFSQIVKKTPVDTGRARGNWIPSVNSPITEARNKKAPIGTTVISEIVSVVPRNAGSVVFLSNNLPYIRRLEEGWSTQSPPQAMVRLSVADFPAMLKAAMTVGDAS